MRARLQLLMEKASQPDVDVGTLMDKPARLSAPEIEQVKTVWRSEAAKELLAEEKQYTLLKHAFDGLVASVACEVKLKLKEDFEKDKEGHLDVIRVLGVIGEAQACFKTLRSGESRSSIIEQTLASVQDSNCVRVKLPDGVLAHARRCCE